MAPVPVETRVIGKLPDAFGKNIDSFLESTGISETSSQPNDLVWVGWISLVSGTRLGEQLARLSAEHHALLPDEGFMLEQRFDVRIACLFGGHRQGDLRLLGFLGAH